MKNKIILFGFVIFLLNFSFLKAQELVNYNLYIQNNYLYNPAYTIDKPTMSAFVNSHIQWSGFDGAPTVNTFGINTPFMKNSGLGLIVYSNTSGLIKEFATRLSYAFRAKFSDEHYLQMGTSLGFLNHKLSGANEFTDVTDVMLLDESFNGTSFSANVGLSYFYKNIEAQVILPQIFHRGDLNLYTVGILAYNYEINTDWLLKPVALVRGFNTSPIQYDISLMGMWQKMLWTQIGYRSNNSMIFGLGVNLKGVEIGYAYQLNNGKIASVSAGTHEIQLIYNFKNVLFHKNE